MGRAEGPADLGVGGSKPARVEEYGGEEMQARVEASLQDKKKAAKDKANLFGRAAAKSASLNHALLKMGRASKRKVRVAISVVCYGQWLMPTRPRSRRQSERPRYAGALPQASRH